MIPFKVQFDKLTEAYIKGEVNPYTHCACFVGNLLNRTHHWGFIRNNARRVSVRDISDPDLDEWSKNSILGAIRSIREESDNTYSAVDISILESTFMNSFEEILPYGLWNSNRDSVPLEEVPEYEHALFYAFEKTLEKLKWIHELKGENVNEYTFSKRVQQLCTA